MVNSNFASGTKKHICFLEFFTLLVLCVTSLIFFLQYSEITQAHSVSKSNIGYLPLEQTVTIKPGDTLLGIISGLGIDKKTVYSLIHSLEKKRRLKSLQVDKQLQFVISSKDGRRIKNGGVPHNVDLYLDDLIFRGSYNASRKSYDFQEEQQQLTSKIKFVEGYLGDNLYKNILTSGATRSIASEYVRLLKNEVNFKRDLKQDTKFRILFKISENKSGITFTKGEILYASLSTGKKEFHLYKFKNRKYNDYFLEDGNVVETNFFIKPIPGARVTSGYGYRIHPIKGCKKFHRGIDFSAKIGTHIKASASGRIEKKKSGKGYGKHIIIRHNDQFSTLYAHMHKFHANIRVGSYVRRGDIIGYVGNTGLSTAPHLHYEVRQYNIPVNPGRVSMYTDKPLKGNHLIAFQKQKSKIKSIIESKSKVLLTN